MACSDCVINSPVLAAKTHLFYLANSLIFCMYYFDSKNRL
ncbi:hypothetical protein Xsto_01382 [Xenorhabdus stockiae]|uniref:Uncharacterized protein n=1 Tax=Xenorhabdus stockiae TaxID=351614 RepID=A0A2D0KSH7_9GAMM|nr:hypothetical protein Xsto_01382 [Xenorhabdus stockiae]PHM69925.1 hypothetical protein Xekj_02194 [Xenorhabdus sp. KJ12.1]